MFMLSLRESILSGYGASRSLCLQIAISAAVICLTTVCLFAQASKSSPPASNAQQNAASSTADQQRTELVEGTVVAVEDGDTFSVLTKDKVLYQVRLQAVDAPENRQPYFEKSRKSLSNLLLKTPVKVVSHSRDSSERLIATVFKNGDDVGLIQIEKGMAWHYKRYSYLQTATNRKSYSDAQAKAVSERIGLWDDKSPLPPWVFRGELTPTATPIRSSGSVTETSTNQDAERKYVLGPRGGCYYVSDSGAKVYVKDKSLCGPVAPVVNKP